MAPPRISARMVARSRVLSDPRWSPSGARLAWLETTDGRTELVAAPFDGSGPPLVVTGDTGASGGFAWASDDELVVADEAGRLGVVAATGGRLRVLTTEGRASGPAIGPDGTVACVIDRGDACDVVTLPLDGSAWPVRVSRADFGWDPAWAPDGRLAWHEWDLPAVPWVDSRVVERAVDGTVRKVASGSGCGQPRYSVTGRLGYLRGQRLWVDDAVVLDEEHEHGEPAWSPGARAWAWSPDGEEVVWCRNEAGFGRLVVGAPGRRSARDLSKGWHRGLDWGAAGIVCIRSGAVTAPGVTVLAPNGSSRRVVARGPVGGFEAAGLVEPRAVSWRSGSTTVPGLLWRPSVPDGQPGLVVLVHGGPTSQALADWNPRVQALVERGWAVLQPNHRGSSGYGDEFRDALDGQWGEHDVADVAAGIRHATREGWGDPGRVVVMGGSAGGFTVLGVAARHPQLVAAVVALYPVTDLLALDATTHRFESGYTGRLVGPLPAARPTYVERSPITAAARIRVPVLLFHGSDDAVVPAEQSEALAAAIATAGTPVERHVFAGEGHGWRRAETVVEEWSRLEDFLRRRLG
ncbi:MAG: S9 family peptidase [Actinomycetota bacterium]